MNNKLLQNFLHDTKTFIERLGALLLQLEKDPANIEIIEQCFRTAHSLKSEASYMDYEGLTQTAHLMESTLEELRTERLRFSDDILEQLLQQLDSLDEQSRLLNREYGSVEAERENRESIVPEPSQSGEKGIFDSDESPDNIQDSEADQVSRFQRSVLEEARSRGELYYRIICELDPEMPLKYAKAYLLINNLELIVNVVSVIPSLDDLEGDFSELNILFTSNVSEGEIYRAVNVDQVDRIQLTTLSFDELSKGTDISEEDIISRDSAGDRDIRVEGESLDRLSSLIEEMRFYFHKSDKPQTGGLKLLEGMEAELKTMRMVPAGELLGGFRRLVRDMARKAGKNINFTLTGSEKRVDRRLIQLILEPLTHLIRNSVDHGIEFPSERENLGKPSEGLIKLSIDAQNDELVISLCDDGRGICRADVLERAEEMGLYKEEERGLLHYLIQPGFSTAPKTTPLSGRGMGLDLIYRSVQQHAGGVLALSTVEGKETSFTISIPRGYNPMSLTIFRAGGGIFAVSTGEISEVKEFNPDELIKEGSGGVFLGEIPVYTVHGRLFMTGQPSRERMALKIEYLGREVCLLVQEFLFEQDLPEDQFKLGREISPHHFEVFAGERKAEYIYLNPSIFV